MKQHSKPLWLSLVVLLILLFSPSVFANSSSCPSGSCSQGSILDELRAAEGVQVVQIAGSLKIILSVDSFFKPQSNTRIQPSKAPILQDIATLLQGYPNSSFDVSGHTDNVGSDESKFFRSRQQAETVTSYLWSGGIPLAKITVIACGDTHPVSSNTILEGSAANRRIEIELVPNRGPRYYK